VVIASFPFFPAMRVLYHKKVLYFNHTQKISYTKIS